MKKAIKQVHKARRAAEKIAQPKTGDLLNEITAIRDALAKSRDRLREIRDEIDGLVESTEAATDELDGAVITLSRYL